jgi:hypothetical protein
VDQALLKEEAAPGGGTRRFWAYGGEFGDTPHDAQVRPVLLPLPPCGSRVVTGAAREEEGAAATRLGCLGSLSWQKGNRVVVLAERRAHATVLWAP